MRENADATRGSGLFRLSQDLGGDLGVDLLLQGSGGLRGPGPSSAPTPRSASWTRAASEACGCAARRATSAGRSARRAASIRVELRGVRAFGDCDDGAPDCPRDDQRSSNLGAEGELAFPFGR